jgi:hypothetical protein
VPESAAVPDTVTLDTTVAVRFVGVLIVTPGLL